MFPYFNLCVVHVLQSKKKCKEKWNLILNRNVQIYFLLMRLYIFFSNFYDSWSYTNSSSVLLHLLKNRMYFVHRATWKFSSFRMFANFRCYNYPLILPNKKRYLKLLKNLWLCLRYVSIKNKKLIKHQSTYILNKKYENQLISSHNPGHHYLCRKSLYKSVNSTNRFV